MAFYTEFFANIWYHNGSIGTVLITFSAPSGINFAFYKDERILILPSLAGSGLLQSKHFGRLRSYVGLAGKCLDFMRPWWFDHWCFVGSFFFRSLKVCFKAVVQLEDHSVAECLQKNSLYKQLSSWVAI